MPRLSAVHLIVMHREWLFDGLRFSWTSKTRSSVFLCFLSNPVQFGNNFFCNHLTNVQLQENNWYPQTCIISNFVPVCQQNVSFKGIYNVLSTQPVLNKVSEITGL